MGHLSWFSFFLLTLQGVFYLRITIADEDNDMPDEDLSRRLGHPLALLLLARSNPAKSRASEQRLVLGKGRQATWLVANKPRGINAQDGENSLAKVLNDAGYPNMIPCHRLDQETTGVIVFAKRKFVKQISESLNNGTKIYRGIVKGLLSGAKKRGSWTQDLSNKAESRRNPRGVAASRVEAVTDYATVADNGYLSLVDFALRTGRTHQIRKHAASQGHPVIGDPRYGDPKHTKKMQEHYPGFEGMALHSALLTLNIDGEKKTFEAPLPESWDPLLSTFDEQADMAVDSERMPKTKVVYKTRSPSNNDENIAGDDNEGDSVVIPQTRKKESHQTSSDVKLERAQKQKPADSKKIPKTVGKRALAKPWEQKYEKFHVKRNMDFKSSTGLTPMSEEQASTNWQQLQKKKKEKTKQ